MNRRGFTLLEIVMALAIVGIMSLMALPRLTAITQRNSLNSARDRVITLYHVARNGAVSGGRATTLHLVDNKAWVTAAGRRNPCPVGPCTIDTLGPLANLSEGFGVAMTSTNTAIGFDVRGLGSGAQTSVTLTRGSYTKSVAFSGYGKVIR